MGTKIHKSLTKRANFDFYVDKSEMIESVDINIDTDSYLDKPDQSNVISSDRQKPPHINSDILSNNDKPAGAFWFRTSHTKNSKEKT